MTKCILNVNLVWSMSLRAFAGDSANMHLYEKVHFFPPHVQQFRDQCGCRWALENLLASCSGNMIMLFLFLLVRSGELDRETV